MKYYEYLERLYKSQQVDNNNESTSLSSSNNQNEEKVTVFSEEIKNKDSNSTIFSDETNPIPDNTPVTNFATTEEIDEFDFNKILKKENNLTEQKDEKSQLENAIENFISFDFVKEKADIDHDGNLSFEEVKNYFKQLAQKDGDNILSSQDFDLELQENGIDLDDTYQKLISDSNEETTSTENLADETSTEQITSTSPETSDQNIQTDTTIPTQDTLNNNVTVAGTSAVTTPTQVQTSQFNLNSQPSSSVYSRQATPKEKTIQQMTLDELQTERDKRQTKLDEAKTAVAEVMNGTNLKVKEAKNKAAAAKTEMEEAVKQDKNITEKDKEALADNTARTEENNSKLEENTTKLDETENNITETKDVVDDIDSASNALQESIGKLQSDLADLNSELSALGISKNEDKKIESKKESLNKKISNKKEKLQNQQSELTEKEKELTEANKKLSELNTEKIKLEEEKKKLEEEKQTLVTKRKEIEEKIEKDCSPKTKAKIKKYDEAVAKIDKIRDSELTKANAQKTTALESLQEVNERIRVVKANKIKAVSADVDLNIENIPSYIREQSPPKIQTLSDGTQVLTLGYTRLDQLQPELEEKIKEMQAVAAEMGLTFVISDASRTVAESNAARSRKGSYVCKGGESPHNYGTAIDICIFKNGKDLSKSEYNEYANNTKAQTGVTWGGDWGSYGQKYERQHFELANWKEYKTSNNLITRHLA